MEKEFDINELTYIDVKKVELFKRNGNIFNARLYDAIKTKRIISSKTDDMKNITIYPSLDAASRILSNGDEKRRVFVKFRIKREILRQNGGKVEKLYWDIHPSDI